MTQFHWLSASALLASLCLAPLAHAVNDPNAPVIKLRHTDSGGCYEGGIALNNCVTGSAAQSISWDNLSGAAAYIVEVGPGSYGQTFCGSASGVAVNKKITVRGAGRDVTTLGSITLTGECKNLNFEDMTVGGTGINYGVVVLTSGSKTTWTNVKLAGSWQEYCGSLGTIKGRHNWYSSQVFLTNGSYYQISCDHSWFHGSEITARGDLTYADVMPLRVGGAELHVYGSVIRAIGIGTGAPQDLYALQAVTATGGEVHIHGTGIDVVAINDAPANATALSASNGATIHANVSAYNMHTGSGGSLTRIANNGGHVHAPYHWEHIPSQPLNSVNGADSTVVTDGTSDGQPHTLLYSNNCTSKWYDAVDKICHP